MCFLWFLKSCNIERIVTNGLKIAILSGRGLGRGRGHGRGI